MDRPPRILTLTFIKLFIHDSKMIRNIAILTFNDLAIAVKNKTLYLVLFIPLFIFLTLTLIDNHDVSSQTIKVGLLEKQNYSPALIQGLQSSGGPFTVSWLPDEETGKQWLKAKNGDGVLIPDPDEAGHVVLIVLAKASLQTVAFVEGVSELQRVLERRNKSWITGIHSLHESALRKQMLPTWILMLVLLVGFIVLPAQVAEEKEKKLLLGLLQTPIREVEWLLAKVFLGMILIAVAALLLQLLAPFEMGLSSGLNYLVFLVAGGFCFSAFGILVGFLCQSQASARTLGVLFYLPHLLPSALADFSQKLGAVAPLIPSYPFYGPVRSILLEGGTASEFAWQGISLLMIGVIALFVSHRLMKQRWLM